MATYLSGSNVKQDTMQTLYLMNPSYNAYNDSPNSGNMVLMSPAAGLSNPEIPLGNLGQQQQQYTGFSLPQTLPQETHAASMSNTNLGHSSSPQEIFANRLSGQSYGWNGGNELLFLPGSDMRGEGQSYAARLNPSPASSMVPHLDTRSLSQSNFQEQVSYIPSGVALGLSAERLPTSAGAGQILSLSLSPQQPALNQLQSFPIQHPELTVNSGSGFNDGVLENFSNKGNQWMGNNLSSFRASSSMLGSGFQSQLSGGVNNRQVSVLSNSPKVELYTSKYLKPAQQLLNEVVSVGKSSKSGSVNQAKTQSWGTPSSFGSGYGQQDKILSEAGGREGGGVANWRNEEGVVSGSIVPMATSGLQEHNVENVVELSAADRQELQLKKAKLLAMIDEVDQRYRQYHHQMQIVVASFETTAGMGAAQTYTALALQTISKHFRCLKDAIRGQIRVACKALGEEVDLGHARGETSRLRFIDQQLRQQRALQQLGMMQQHPWRPQRGLPERSVSVLRAWLFEHFLHPYPKDSDKVMLARQTGLTRNQVSNWFINARVRLWKPMVEEMYVEEVKEDDEKEETDKPTRDQGEDRSKGAVSQDGGGNNDPSRLSKQGKLSDFKTEGFLEAREGIDRDSDLIQSKVLTASLPDHLLLQEREHLGQAVKRVGSDLSASLDIKMYDIHGGQMLAKPRPTENDFGIPAEGLIQEDNQGLGSYGLFQLSGLSRYSSEGLATPYPNNTAVSLTLGLQRSEGLTVPGSTPQNFLQGQGQGHLLIGRRQEGEMNAVNYYGVHDISGGGHPGGYDVLALQDRKRFASHMLEHDYT